MTKARIRKSFPSGRWTYLLFPFALLYGGVVWLRNRFFDWGVFSSHAFQFPVISVGNLSVGGTGKTPHVEWLIRRIQPRYLPAVLSRGYGRKTKGFLLADEQASARSIGDEPLQYHIKFPSIPVAVAEQRLLGIPLLLQARPETQVILLDDAFQHRRVRPGMQLLITPYDRPFTEDCLLPMGRLREGRKEAARADIIVVSRCPADMSPQQQEEWQRSLTLREGQEVYFSSVRYGQPYDLWTGESREVADKWLFLITGIAEPEPLRHHLFTLSKNIHFKPYADHYDFSEKDIRGWHRQWSAVDREEKLMVTTEKDATRLRAYQPLIQSLGLVFVVIPIEVMLQGDKEEELLNRLFRYIDIESQSLN